MKLVDANNNNEPVADATVRIGFNDVFVEVTTNKFGKATFDVSSRVRQMTLQVADASDDVSEPMFELHDDFDFLKDAEVDIVVLERMVTRSFVEKITFYQSLAFLINKGVMII